MIIRFIIFFIFISFKSYATDCEKPKMPTDEEWKSWLTNIKQEALERGISQNTISNNLNDVKPQSKIIMRDRCQPASTMTLDEYLFYTITKDKVFAGKNFLKKHKDLLKEIGDYFFEFALVTGYADYSPKKDRSKDVLILKPAKVYPQHTILCGLASLAANKKPYVMEYDGDAKADANAAKAAGMPIILLEDGYTEKNTTEIYHNHLVKDFINIEKIVSKYL